MPSLASRLRRWIALAAFLVLAVIAGFYDMGVGESTP